MYRFAPGNNLLARLLTPLARVRRMCYIIAMMVQPFQTSVRSKAVIRDAEKIRDFCVREGNI